MIAVSLIVPKSFTILKSLQTGASMVKLYYFVGLKEEKVVDPGQDANNI